MPRATSRRSILKQAATASVGALTFPYIVPASALGKGDKPAPSNRIVMGTIGTGGQGRGNMGRLMKFPEVQMVAVCDVDANQRDKARDEVNKKYGNNDCETYNDFRELVARDDINAVIVGTPDHWHALTAIAAAEAGKDIYCEKPLTNSVGEGKALVEAVRANKVILQTGSQERSGPNARFACELVRNGRIGKLHTIQINLPCSDGHHKEVLKRNANPSPAQPKPEHFDYDFWLGHTPKVGYHQDRCHFWWRFNLAYGGGEMTDRGAHIIDLAQLGNGTDDTNPVEFSAKGKRCTEDKCLYNTFMEYEFECKYSNGVTMVGSSSGQRGLKFIGSDGWIFIKIHGAKLEAEPKSLLDEKIGDDEIRLGRVSGDGPRHHKNFLDAVKSRHQPMAHVEIGHRTGSICHLNNIAMITGRKLKWDPAAEQIIDDPGANDLLTPKMRPPWHL